MINLIEKFWNSEVRQMLTLATGIYFDYYLSAIGAMITIISSILVYTTASRRAIHDYIAKTTVVGIEGEASVPKNRKEINTHKIQEGHFCPSFLHLGMKM